MNNKIYYLCYYDTDNNGCQDRKTIVAAVNKLRYIFKALKASKHDVEILSVASTQKLGIVSSKRIIEENGFTLHFPAALGGNSAMRLIDLWWRRFWLAYNLFFSIPKKSTVVVYHSTTFMSLLKFFKKIKKLKLVLELEEIYGDVINSEALRKKELNLVANADAFIFPTELLNKKLNPSGKPMVIIYGTYQVEPQVVEKWTDGRVHVVYAGTFDPCKGGAVAAIAAATFLPENYHIHICGFGNEDDTRSIKKVVDDTAVHSRAKVTFHGLLKGREYIEFIQRCHIGLSTQDPSAAFNATSFPSKILSYMANGLEVVSIDIPAIREASISTNIHFYGKQTPEQIAKAITAVDLSHPHNNRALIASLSEKFINDLPFIL